MVVQQHAYPPLHLAGGAVTYSFADARQTLGGYAFARSDLNLNPLPAEAGAVPSPMDRPTWSSAIYDYQPSDLGPLNFFDVIVSVGLSSRIKESAIAGMLEMAPLVSEALDHIPLHQTFWDLSAADVRTLPAHSHAWWMYRAVELLDSVPDVAPTVAHKTLHHKRPWLFPLLDNETMTVLPYKESWTMIHDDLSGHAAQFAALEQWSADESATRESLPLTRLRTHDILVWTDVKRQRHDARAAGEALGF
jgi:hypothetical protein